MLLNLDIDPANVDPNGIAAALPVTTADPNGIAAALPVDTVWTQADDSEYITEIVNGGKSQHIIVTTGADETTPQSTMTLVGTDRDGNTITEDLTLPSSSTVVSTKQFLTVDQIFVDVLTTGVTDVGWLITSWNLAETALWLIGPLPDFLAHQLVVTTTGNEPAGADPLLTIIGTDADDRVQTETVVMPNATTVETTKYFKTVTEASTGENAVAGVFDIGWVDEVSSETIPLFWRKHVPSNWWLDVTGTLSVSVEFTMDDWRSKEDQAAVLWVAGDAALTAETADSSAVITVKAGYTAARLIYVSYTDTAECQLRGTQAEAR
jgi:hypothetical protein